MVRAAELEAVLRPEGNSPATAAPRRARRQDEHVADQPADRMARAARDRRGDEVMRYALEQRHLAQRGRAQRLRIAALPVLVDERATAQVADAGAAAAQEGSPRTGVGQAA